MKVRLIKIIEGAKYQNEIWDYWLLIQLNNGQVLQLFDRQCFASSLVEGELYNVKLSSSSFFVELSIDSLILFGDIEEKEGEKIFQNESIEILIRESDEIKICKESFFSIGRIDLEDITPEEIQ